MKPSEYVRKGWTQHAWARDIHNEKVPPHSPLAVAWCVSGAIIAAIRNEFDQEAFFKTAHFLLGDRTLGAWNDGPGRTQHEAISALEEVEKLLPVGLTGGTE